MTTPPAPPERYKNPLDYVLVAGTCVLFVIYLPLFKAAHRLSNTIEHLDLDLVSTPVLVPTARPDVVEHVRADPLGSARCNQRTASALVSGLEPCGRGLRAGSSHGDVYGDR